MHLDLAVDDKLGRANYTCRVNRRRLTCPVSRQLHRMQAELEAAMEEEVSKEREEAKKKRGGWNTRPRDFTHR